MSGEFPYFSTFISLTFSLVSKGMNDVKNTKKSDYYR